MSRPEAGVNFRAIVCLCLGCVLWLLCAGPAPGQSLSGGASSETQRELEYAEALMAMGLADYAQMIIERLGPAGGYLAKTIKVQTLASQGKFDEAKTLISGEPDQNSQQTWAMKLALGDGYYAWGKYAEAQGIYESLFKSFPSGPPKSLNSFYMDSAYKYAQMLLLMDEPQRALKAFRNVLKADLPEHVKRQVQGETAELLAKLAADPEHAAQRDAYFKEIEKILNVILWKQDLWFGKGVVIMAHMKMLQGDVDGAMRLVDLYREQLVGIDNALEREEELTGEPLTRLSPMAQVRYLIGTILQDRAEKLLEEGGSRQEVVKLLVGEKVRDGRTSGALQHFANVFIRYPGTQWAPDAGARLEEVKRILKREFDTEPKINISEEQMEQVEQFQFQNARTLFNQNQFEPAVEQYVKVLNLFPEGETPVYALGELALCYLELREDPASDLYAETTTRYLAERFGEHPKLMNGAGDQVLRIASKYEELGEPEMKDEVYDLFFRHFKGHPQAPTLIFGFGERKVSEEDYDGALKYYTQVVNSYSNVPVYYAALSKVAYCHNRNGDHVEEIRTLDRYIDAVTRKEGVGHEVITAKFRLANAYKQLDPKYIPNALKRYAELVKMLTQPDAVYHKTVEQKRENEAILEGSMYYQALCYSLLKTDEPARANAYRAHAIKSLEALIGRYPESKFAPAALSQIGALYTVLEKPDEAREALKRLQEDYPNTPEAKNALFMLAKSLLELGMRKQATEVFREMFQAGGSYSEAQILTAGRELAKAGEYEIALTAFERVLSSARQRGLVEPALLGKGEVLIEQGRFEAGAKAIEQMLERFPRSGYTVEACRYLSRAYAELGAHDKDKQNRFDLFNKAVLAMKRARPFEKNSGGKARLDLEVGRIMELKAQAEKEFGTATRAREYHDEAIATYQMLILLGNFADPDVRAAIEEAYKRCIPLLMETERWKDAVGDCDAYLDRFRSGRHVLDVRRWRSQAQIKLAMAGGDVPEQGSGEAGTQATNAAEAAGAPQTEAETNEGEEAPPGA